MKEKAFNLNRLIRPSVRSLQPYSSARDEFKGSNKEVLFFDANENPFSNGYNRYPDPKQSVLRLKLSQLKSVSLNQVFLGNGSDEVLDILLRAFCEPHKDNVILTPPTYGMYEVLAHINEVQVKKVNLLGDFQLPVNSIKEHINERSKLLFICSPNNPTGNSFHADDIEELLNSFDGLVIIDEAYIHFSKATTWINRLSEFPNLIVVQTFSKAYGNAGIRLGVCYGSEKAIAVLNKVKAPYNVSEITQEKALKTLTEIEKIEMQLTVILREREKLTKALKKVHYVFKVYPSDANFLLIKVDDATKRYHQLIEKGIVVRNRSSACLCEDCIRISVGTPKENEVLINVLKQLR